MDALEKSFGDDLARDMSAKPDMRARPVNGSPKTVRLGEQIDLLIADFKLRIEMLQKIRESL
jgi:hypothetical protein